MNRSCNYFFLIETHAKIGIYQLCAGHVNIPEACPPVLRGLLAIEYNIRKIATDIAIDKGRPAERYILEIAVNETAILEQGPKVRVLPPEGTVPERARMEPATPEIPYPVEIAILPLAPQPDMCVKVTLLVFDMFVAFLPQYPERNPELAYVRVFTHSAIYKISLD
jgi:hypothetical protein